MTQFCLARCLLGVKLNRADNKRFCDLAVKEALETIATVELAELNRLSKKMSGPLSLEAKQASARHDRKIRRLVAKLEKKK